jgi:putative phosphoesterase
MRVMVISDIHGNRLALDAALADIKGKSIDKIVCLGDTIQGGSQPKEIVEKLKEMKAPVVMGNADAWLLSEKSDAAEPMAEEQREVRRWTLSKLTRDDLDFVRTYRSTIDIELDKNRQLLCFHGSPKSYDDVLRPDTPREKWDRLLGPYSPAIMAGGHTHTQQVRRVGDGLFFNPGSIGVVFNTLFPEEKYRLEPWAEYAILTYDNGLKGLEFRRAHYDLKELVRVIRASGRPHADKMVADYSRR